MPGKASREATPPRPHVMDGLLLIAYMTPSGGRGFVRADQITVIEEIHDLQKTRTGIRLLDGSLVIAQESVHDLMEALTGVKLHA